MMTWDTGLMRLRHGSWWCRLVLTHVAPWIRVGIAWSWFSEVGAAKAVGHVKLEWHVRIVLGHTLFVPRHWELTGYGLGGTLVVWRGCCYKSTSAITKKFMRHVATVINREHRINLIRRSWLKHKRTRQFTCSLMDILPSEYAPRLGSDDDIFTKPLGRTEADLSITYVQRFEAYQMNSDLVGFNISRLLDIHSPIDLMHFIILDFRVAHSHWLQDEYSWLSSA